MGCGAGNLLNQLALLFPEAEFIGIDSNENSIKKANLHVARNCQFICSPFDQSEKLGEFDVVICSEVFEHVEDSGRLLYEISCLVREGGYLSISTPSGWMYRIPRLVNIKMFIRNPVAFVQLFLFPERNWKEALPIHPAIQPVKLVTLLKQHGFRLIYRHSSLWLQSEKSVFFRLLKAKEKKSPIGAGLRLYHHVAVLDALMNVVPCLGIFESRFVLLMEKTG